MIAPIKIEKQQFKNQAVVLDGKEFIDCIFENCVLHYGGSAPYGANRTKWINCGFQFINASAQTLQVMTALYAQGGEFRAIVENVIKEIQGAKPPKPH